MKTIYKGKGGGSDTVMKILDITFTKGLVENFEAAKAVIGGIWVTEQRLAKLEQVEGFDVEPIRLALHQQLLGYLQSL